MIEYNLEGNQGVRALHTLTVDNVKGYSYTLLKGDYLWPIPGLTLQIFAPEGALKPVTRRRWHKFWLRKRVIHGGV